MAQRRDATTSYVMPISSINQCVETRPLEQRRRRGGGAVGERGHGQAGPP
jgi:hypothetical protein